MILLFPDGILHSARWRWVLRAYLVVVAVLVVSAYTVIVIVILGHHVRLDASGGARAGGRVQAGRVQGGPVQAGPVRAGADGAER